MFSLFINHHHHHVWNKKTSFLCFSVCFYFSLSFKIHITWKLHINININININIFTKKKKTTHEHFSFTITTYKNTLSNTTAQKNIYWRLVYVIYGRVKWLKTFENQSKAIQTTFIKCNFCKILLKNKYCIIIVRKLIKNFQVLTFSKQTFYF